MLGKGFVFKVTESPWTVSNEMMGNISKMGWSEYGFSQACTYHLELNWTEYLYSGQGRRTKMNTWNLSSPEMPSQHWGPNMYCQLLSLLLLGDPDWHNDRGSPALGSCTHAYIAFEAINQNGVFQFDNMITMCLCTFVYIYVYNYIILIITFGSYLGGSEFNRLSLFPLQ